MTLYISGLSHSDSLSTDPFPVRNCAQIGLHAETKKLFIDQEDPLIRIERRPTQDFAIRVLKNNHCVRLNNVPILEAFVRPKDQVHIGDQVLSFSDSMKLSEVSIPTSHHARWNGTLSSLPNIAVSPFPVLIMGPSGSGKDKFARDIHALSPYKHGPFVSLNCGAISQNLIESELFGHKKGSFTGATHDRKGAFESATGGTLFLDEVAEFPLHLQSQLLRALENHEIKPVGTDRVVKTHCRIIAATHQNLLQLVAQGRFRDDLYFRLNVISLTVPSLAQRMLDFENFLYHFSKEYRVSFSFAAIQAMKRHCWPGNLRELRNSVQRASVLFGRQSIQEAHLPLLIDLLQRPNLISKNQTEQTSSKTAIKVDRASKTPSILKTLERDLILKALVDCNGNQRQAALTLGMPKSTLYDRIKNYENQGFKITV